MTRCRRIARRFWPELELVNPDEKTTDAGFTERRQVHYVTREQHRKSMNRVAFFGVLVGAVASLSAGLSYNAGETAGDDRRENSAQRTIQAHRSVISTCVAGVELRLASAAGLETLRTQAIGGPDGLRGELRLQFIRRTQGPIDDLLSQAAGRRIRAPVPPGAVTAAVQDRVWDLANKRCKERADIEWPLPGEPDKGG